MSNFGLASLCLGAGIFFVLLSLMVLWARALERDAMGDNEAKYPHFITLGIVVSFAAGAVLALI